VPDIPAFISFRSPMSNHWDFYFSSLDGHAASTFVDVGLGSSAPDAALGEVLQLRLSMQQPRPDGLSSGDEYGALVAIEDAIEARLANGRETKYVGRTTVNGYRDFYLYTGAAGTLTQALAEVMRQFPAYRFTTSSRPDLEWRTYFDLLLPNAEEREQIKNHKVREVLKREGDHFREEREIDHWAYFPGSAARGRFIDQALDLGFKLRGKSEPQENKPRYGAQLYKSGSPRYPDLDQEALALFRLAVTLGGEYDDWETQVVR
jgi:Family of unknown function (DUF695)/Regulator of ribonuclease activity B